MKSKQHTFGDSSSIPQGSISSIQSPRFQWSLLTVYSRSALSSFIHPACQEASSLKWDPRPSDCQ